MCYVLCSFCKEALQDLLNFFLGTSLQNLLDITIDIFSIITGVGVCDTGSNNIDQIIRSYLATSSLSLFNS